MDKEYVMHIAQTIKEQLVSLTPMPILMSWGIGDFVATVFRDLPALRIKVNGRLHAGNVVIALNGSDYYEVYLLKENGAECVNEEVCFDELAMSLTEPSKAVRTKRNTTNSATGNLPYF